MKRRIIIDAGTGIRLLGKKIMLEDLNYWNVDLQEAYYSFIEAQLKRENLK